MKAEWNADTNQAICKRKHEKERGSYVMYKSFVYKLKIKEKIQNILSKTVISNPPFII